MRQMIMVSIACLSALVFPAVAGAGTYIFHPSPGDLNDLDHSTYYIWGINWSIPAGQAISGASLFIDDLSNWQVESDHLYIHLLDDPALGTSVFGDSDGSGDHFSGQPLVTYMDSSRPASLPATWWTYTFTPTDLQTLTQYVSNNNRFGFGIDPDCHYYNSGVTFTINTQSVPEPLTALLAAPAFALLRRARNRRLPA